MKAPFNITTFTVMVDLAVLCHFRIEAAGFNKPHLSVAVLRKIVVAAQWLTGCRQIILKARNKLVLILS